MKLSRTNGRGLDLFQQLTRGRRLGIGSPSIARDRDLRWRPHVRVRDAAVTVQTARNPGDPSGEATPVPIPNTEVKLPSAEDTERAAFRENRSSPGLLRIQPSRGLPLRLSSTAWPQPRSRRRRRPPSLVRASATRSSTSRPYAR